MSERSGAAGTSKRRYDRLKAAGLCVSCGWREALPGRTRCQWCRDKASAVRAKEVYKAKIRARRDQGLCVRCGAPARPGKANCLSCAVKWAAYKRARRAAAGPDGRPYGEGLYTQLMTKGNGGDEDGRG